MLSTHFTLLVFFNLLLYTIRNLLHDPQHNLRRQEILGPHFGLTGRALGAVRVDGGEEALIAERFGAFGAHPRLETRVIADKTYEIVGYKETIFTRLHY